VDYQKFDPYVRRLYQLLQKASGTLALSSVRFDTWRWDSPEASLKWSKGDDIFRNISTLVTGSDEPTGVQIEINAWKDIESERKWVNVRIGEYDLAFINDDKLEGKLLDAVRQANDLTEGSLVNEAILRQP